MPLPKRLNNMSFSLVSIYAYNEFQMIIIGVNVLVDGIRHFLVSPGRNYLFKETDELVCISSYKKDLVDFFDLVRPSQSKS